MGASASKVVVIARKGSPQQSASPATLGAKHLHYGHHAPDSSKQP